MQKLSSKSETIIQPPTDWQGLLSHLKKLTCPKLIKISFLTQTTLHGCLIVSVFRCLLWTTTLLAANGILSTGWDTKTLRWFSMTLSTQFSLRLGPYLAHCVSVCAKVDEIYHLASPASPPHYMYNPVKTIKTNTVGTVNMLGLAKRTNATILIQGWI